MDVKKKNNILNIITGAQNLGVLLFVIVLFVIVSLMSENFLTFNNISNILVQTSILSVVAYGMTFAIVLGMFDLSVGSTQALVAAVVATRLLDTNIIFSIIIGLAIGTFVGIINGIVITKLKVPAFVATLAMMTIIRGAALLYTDGQSILIRNQSFNLINTTRIVGIPLPFLISVVILIVYWYIFNHTTFGRHVAAIGGNIEAVEAAGIKSTKIIIVVFGIVGLSTAISGILLSSQLMNVSASIGTGLEMNAIAAVVLGGTDLKGGRGNLIGTILGAFLLSSISNALNILNIPSYFQYFFTGALLIIALSLDFGRKKFIQKMIKGGELV